MTRDRNFRLCSASLLLALIGGGCMGHIDSSVDPNPETSSGVSEALNDAQCPPSVPAALVVPAGNKLGFAYDAAGDQIYECRVSGASYAWALKAPDADLFKINNGNPIGSHYAGPTWEHQDGSLVVGARVAGATVDATAVPWLLLSAVSHTGEGRMDAVSFIQRLSTTGGLAPTTGCDAGHVGALQSIHYTATYYFFVPNDGNAGGAVCN